MKFFVFTLFLSFYSLSLQAQWQNCQVPDESVITGIHEYQNLLLATSNGGGVYYSSNNGQSWRTLNQGLSNFNVLCMEFHNDEIYIGTQLGGIFKLKDFYSTWEHIITPIPQTDILDLKWVDTLL